MGGVFESKKTGYLYYFLATSVGKGADVSVSVVRGDVSGWPTGISTSKNFGGCIVNWSKAYGLGGERIGGSLGVGFSPIPLSGTKTTTRTSIIGASLGAQAP